MRDLETVFNRRSRHRIRLAAVMFVWFAAFALSTTGEAQQSRPRSGKSAPPREPGLIWREPTDIKRRDLFYGAGGKDRQPQGRLTFLEEDKGGTNPKFSVVDERGVRWKVKLGSEAQPETAATRLIWAAGYFVDEDYYLPEIKVEKLPRLKRGRKFVSTSGVVRGARLERDEKGDKKLGEWDWFNNPFTGTRELNGLRILMALINNWDPKPVNNSIRARQGVARAYYVSDLGASFGRTGGTLSRSRNDLKGYVGSKFVRRVKGEKADFVLRTRPSFFMIVYPPYYNRRTRLGKIAQDLPVADAHWLGELLNQLSPQQIADAFRAAGYSPEQVAAYSKKVNDRISELMEL